MHKFVVEFAVKIGINRRDRLIFRENVRERNIFVILGFTLLGETFGAEDFGVGVFSMPRSKEDVVLNEL